MPSPRLQLNLSYTRADGKPTGCSLDYQISDHDARGVAEALEKVPDMIIPGEIVGQIIMALRHIGGDLKVTDMQVAKSWKQESDRQTAAEKDAARVGTRDNPGKPEVEKVNPNQATGKATEARDAGEPPKQPTQDRGSQAGGSAKRTAFPKGTKFYRDGKNGVFASLPHDGITIKPGDKEITEDEYRAAAG